MPVPSVKTDKADVGGGDSGTWDDLMRARLNRAQTPQRGQPTSSSLLSAYPPSSTHTPADASPGFFHRSLVTAHSLASSSTRLLPAVLLDVNPCPTIRSCAQSIALAEVASRSAVSAARKTITAVRVNAAIFRHELEMARRAQMRGAGAGDGDGDGDGDGGMERIREGVEECPLKEDWVELQVLGGRVVVVGVDGDGYGDGSDRLEGKRNVADGEGTLRMGAGQVYATQQAEGVQWTVVRAGSVECSKEQSPSTKIDSVGGQRNAPAPSGARLYAPMADKGDTEVPDRVECAGEDQVKNSSSIWRARNTFAGLRASRRALLLGKPKLSGQ